MKIKNKNGQELELKDLSNESLLTQYCSLYEIAKDTQKESDWNNYKEIRNEILKRMGE